MLQNPPKKPVEMVFYKTSTLNCSVDFSKTGKLRGAVITKIIVLKTAGRKAAAFTAAFLFSAAGMPTPSQQVSPCLTSRSTYLLLRFSPKYPANCSLLTLSLEVNSSWPATPVIVYNTLNENP